MFKKFIPFAHAESVFEIDNCFFEKQNISTLFIDLDNTLDSYKSKIPTERAKKLIIRLSKAGITPIIISNNRGKRVSRYANELNVDFVNSAGKPFPCRINKEIKKRGLDKQNVMLVGDQIITDVLAGRNAGIRVVLTEKIVKEDQPTTHFNRIFDRPIRKYHRKHGNLKNWRNI